MNGRTPLIRNQMKKDEPLILPTSPPASAKEKAMTRYATGSAYLRGGSAARRAGSRRGGRRRRERQS